jgi:hypothetical protein
VSQESVRRYLSAKRAYADTLEHRAQDPDNPIFDPAHREHLLIEARHAREEADAAEARSELRVRTSA